MSLLTRREALARAGSLALAPLASGVLAPHPARAQTATIAFRFNDADQAGMRRALDQFEATAGVRVTLQRSNWGEAREQLLREVAVRSGPDVVHLAFVWPLDLARAEALLPLGERIRRDGIGAAGWSDFFATELATDAQQQIWAVPWTMDTFAMVYRTDVLREAGIAQLPRTWEELRATSRQIRQRTGRPGWGMPAGSGAGNTIWSFLNFYWWSKGRALVAQQLDGRFVIDISPEEIADGFAYFASYFSEGHVDRRMLAVANWGATEVTEGIVAGEVGMVNIPNPVFTQVLDQFRARFPGREPPFVTGPQMTDKAGPKSFIGGRMLAINRNSRNPDAAWRLIRHLVEPAIFRDHYKQFPPSQRSLIRSLADDPLFAGYVEQFGHARTWGAYASGPIGIPAMWNTTGRLAGAVFIGEMPAQEAGRQLHRFLETEMARR